MSLNAAPGAGPLKTGACHVLPPSLVTSSSPPDATAPWPAPSSAIAVKVVEPIPGGTTWTQDWPALRVIAT